MNAEGAAAQLRTTDQLALGLAPGQPAGLLHALGERDDFLDLQVFCALLTEWYPLFTHPGVKLMSGFFGPAERILAKAGHDIEFVPADFRGFTRVIRGQRPRVLATAVTPPDASGRLSLALHAGAGVDELHRCGADPDRVLIAEINPLLPYTHGLPPEHTHSLHVDEVDVLYESEHPVFEVPETEPSEAEAAIAEHVRSFISDGATMQTGIGGVPNAVMTLLAEGDGGDYGVHSEMFTTGLMRLHQAGKVSNQKGIYDGFTPTTFAAGTRALYDWLDHNQDVRFLPVEYVNEPALIGKNRNFISINGALSVDAQGQIVADSVAGQQFSGIGGHEDFVMGANTGLPGRSLICLPATARVDGAVISRIVSQHPAGSMITTPRHHTDVIVTEYGAAQLAGYSVSQRREALAAISHPAVREALRAGENELPLIEGPAPSPDGEAS